MLIFYQNTIAPKRRDRLEYTYNAYTDEYHPHFHLVVANADSPRLLVLRWLERHPEAADVKGQDLRARDNGNLAREMFKYFTNCAPCARIAMKVAARATGETSL
jgi:hypothetical protein